MPFRAPATKTGLCPLHAECAMRALRGQYGTIKGIDFFPYHRKRLSCVVYFLAVESSFDARPLHDEKKGLILAGVSFPGVSHSNLEGPERRYS